MILDKKYTSLGILAHNVTNLDTQTKQVYGQNTIQAHSALFFVDTYKRKHDIYI